MAPLFSDFYHVHRSYYREVSICLFGGSFQDLVTLYLWKSGHKWTISDKLQTLVLMQNSKNKLNWLWDIHPPSVHYHQVQEKTWQQVTQLTSQLQAWTFVLLSSSHLDLSAFDCTLQFTWMIKWLDLQTAALAESTGFLEGQPRECYGIPWRLIAIKLLLSRQQNAIQNYFSYFQPKHMV